MAPSQPLTQKRQLARQVRERFVQGACQGLDTIANAIHEFLTNQLNQTLPLGEMQVFHERRALFQAGSAAWVEGTTQAWKALSQQAVAVAKARSDTLTLELMDDDMVENKIVASRLALPVSEKVSASLSDLSARMQQLEEGREIVSGDILRPEVLVQIMVDQWVKAGLSRAALMDVKDIVQNQLTDRLLAEYGHATDLLTRYGIVPQTNLRSKVKRAADSPVMGPVGGNRMHRADFSSTGPHSGPSPVGHAHPPYPGHDGGSGMVAPPYMGGGYYNPGYQPQGHGAYVGGAANFSHAQAQNIVGQLRRLLTEQVAGFAHTPPQVASPMLMQAIALQPGLVGNVASAGSPVVEDYSPAGLVRVSQAIRERSADLKQKATTDNEKATIEVVGLMFQSILTEERLAPNVRVWFSRLQVPVLRVALAEPEFLSSLNHPARLLIDRMGSCVLGFDSSAISGSAMEAEIRRVVQVIEQYPETGQRVFQLVLNEFENFVAKHLAENKTTARVISVAQQVEQKETLTIQYTIELRKLLTDMPMREEIRSFLFKIWAEVLAVADLRNGPKDPMTQALKKTASDLVWAASAKPHRAERTKVIQSLPLLLQHLRQGLTLLGIVEAQQDAHIKAIGDTLTAAFLSKTEAIPQARIDAMAQQLANLEELIQDESMAADLSLNPGSIEVMLGMDAASITVVTDGDAQPAADMLQWARDLLVGHWFTIDHNSLVKQVQLAWRSERRQLFLFAALDGSSYLIQSRRLASYLQTGLMRPHETEALTQRATRDALAKLDANPERLLR